jgi:hypothetical protein
MRVCARLLCRSPPFGGVVSGTVLNSPYQRLENVAELRPLVRLMKQLLARKPGLPEFFAAMTRRYAAFIETMGSKFETMEKQKAPAMQGPFWVSGCWCG